MTTNSTSSSPALLDAAFNTLLPAGVGNAYVYGNFAGPSAYLEVLNGATLKTWNVTIGHASVAGRGGVLTLKTGSSITGSGNLTVGGTGDGILIAENGLTSFSFPNLIINSVGTMDFVFGSDSVSTFTVSKSSSAATFTVNGVIEVDLGALTENGTYTLITSTHADTAMSGAFATWLSGQGGTYTNAGSYGGNYFKVLNGEGKNWTLSNATDPGVLTLTVIPEPATVGLFVVSGVAVLILRRISR
jgi:hypothetical protein